MARRYRLLFRVPGRARNLVRGDHHPAAEAGEQQRPTRSQLLGNGAVRCMTSAARAIPTATIVQRATSTIRLILADNLSLIAAEIGLPKENGTRTSPVASALRTSL